MTGNQTPSAMAMDSGGSVIVAGYQKVCSNNVNQDCSTDAICGTGNYCNSKFYTIKVTDNGTSGSVAWPATLNRCSNSNSNPLLVCTVGTKDADCGGTTNSCNVTPPDPGDQIQAVAVDSASPNNVIVSGYIYDGNYKHCTVVKYNGATGAKAWHYIYGGNVNSECSSLVVDNTNGRIYAGGYTEVPGNGDDALIVKLNLATGALDTAFNNPNGYVTYNSSGNNSDRINALALTGADIVATGYSYVSTNDFDYLTLKYNASGAQQWGGAKTYSSSAGSGNDKAYAIKADASGNVVVSGQVNGNDIYTLKYNGTNGNCMWGYTYGGGGNDKPSALWFSSGTGDFYVSGYTSTLSNGYDYYAARYSGSVNNNSCSVSTGVKTWEKTTGTSGDDYTDPSISTVPANIAVDSGGDVFVTGRISKGGDDFDWMTVKFNGSNGNVLWQTVFNGNAGKNDQPVGLALSPAGDLFVAGHSDNWTGSASDYDYYVIKYDRGLLNPPTGLTATALTNTSIQLTWTDNSSNENQFKIERKLGETSYYGTCSSHSGTACNQDKECPSFSTGETCNATTSFSVQWGSANVSHYCSNAPGTTCTQDSNCAPGTCTIWTYVDSSGLSSNNYYYYRVRAHKDPTPEYWSNYSNEAHALTWVVAYGNPSWIYPLNYNGAEDLATGIVVGPDDNPVATGHVVSGGQGEGYYTVKLYRGDATCVSSHCSNDSNKPCTTNTVNNDCLPIWSDRYISTGSEDARGIAADSQGNVTVTGNSLLWSGKCTSDYGTICLDDDQCSEGHKPCINGYSNTNHIYTIKYDQAGPSGTGQGIWNAAYSSSYQIDYDEKGRTVAAAADGSDNIGVVGYGQNAASGGNADIIVLKYLARKRCSNLNGVACNDSGDCGGTGACGVVLDWEAQPYAGTGNDHDYPTSAAFDSDGNLFVIGYVKNSGTGYDYFTAKYCGSRACSNNVSKACGKDADCNSGEGTCTGRYARCKTGSLDKDKGEIIWSDIYDGTSHGNDYATSLAVDKKRCSNDFGKTCNANSDCAASGLCDPSPHTCTNIPTRTCSADVDCVDCTANVYVTGYEATASQGQDWRTIKYNGKNNLGTGDLRRLWTSPYDGPAHGDDRAEAVRIDPIDGAVVVAGTSLISAGNGDFHVVRYNPIDGRTDTAWPNPTDPVECRRSDCQCGPKNSCAGACCGVVGWDVNFGRPANDDAVTAMQIDPGGYIYMAGDTHNSNWEVMSVIYDFEGTFMASMIYDNGLGKDARTRDDNISFKGGLAANNQAEAFIAGYTINSSDNKDFLVLKHVNNPNIVTVPAPFTATPQADSGQMKLDWGEKTASVDKFTVCRTPGPYSQYSSWTCWDVVNTNPACSTASGLTTCTYTDTGRSPETNYCYRIEAVKGSWNSRKTVTCAFTNLVAPTWNNSWYNNTEPFSNISLNSLTINWNGVTDASTYTLQRSLDGISWTDVCVNTTALSCQASDLSSGTLYYFRVRALGPNGTPNGYSLWSSAVSARTYPAAPTWYNGWGGAPFSARSETSLTVYWRSVSGATSYALEQSLDGSTGWTSVSGCTPTAGTDSNYYCTVSGLTQGTHYYLRVKAKLQQPWGDWFESTWSNPLTDTYTMPVAPALSTVVRNATCGDDYATITWTWSGPGAETGFLIKYITCNNSNSDPTDCHATTGNWTGWANAVTGIGSAERSKTYTMTKGTAYRFVVYATVNGGAILSQSSAEGSVWACMGITQNAIQPATSNNHPSLKISWGDANDSDTVLGNTYYDVWREMCDAGCNVDTCASSSGGYGTNPIKSQIGPTTASWIDDTSPTQGKSYAYKIKAYRSLSGSYPLPLADSAWSGEKCAVVPPPVPESVTLTNITNTPDNRITVNWKNGRCAGSDLVPCTAATQNTDCAAYADKTCIVNTYTGYEIQRATAYYNSSSQYPDHDGDPTGAWSWSATIINSGDTSNTDGARLYFTDTNLTPAGQGYSYKVRGKYGSGSTTDWTVITCTSSQHVTCNRTYPPQTTGLSATANSTTQITVNWSDVVGDAGYDLRYQARSGSSCPAAGDWGTALAPGENATSYTVSVSTAGYYCFEIRACRAYSCSSSNGYGAWSSVFPRETLLAAPDPVTVSNSDPQLDNPATQLYVTWTQVNLNNGYSVVRNTRSTCTSAVNGTYTACTKNEDCPSHYLCPSGWCGPCRGATTFPQGTNSISFKDTGLTPGEVYYYQVYTINSDNNPSTSSTQKKARTRSDASVMTPTLSVLSPNSMSVSWPVVYGANKYKIYRKPQSGSYSMIADVGLCSNNIFKTCTTATQATDCGTGNTCTGANVGICSNNSTYQTCTTDSCGGTGRCLGPFPELFCNQSVPYSGCTALSVISPTYTDSDSSIQDGTTYCYQVTAYNDGAGLWATSSLESAAGPEQCAVTLDVAKPTLSCANCTGCPTCVTTNSLRVGIDWSYSATNGCSTTCKSDISGVEIEFMLTNGQWFPITTKTAADHDTFIHMIGINPGTPYHYRARAYRCEDSGQNICPCGQGNCSNKIYSAYSDVLNVTTRSYTTGDNVCR